MKYIDKIFNFSSATHPDTLTVLISDPNYVSPEGGSSEGSSTALRAPLSAAFSAHRRLIVTMSNVGSSALGTWQSRHSAAWSLPASRSAALVPTSGQDRHDRQRLSAGSLEACTVAQNRSSIQTL